MGGRSVRTFELAEGETIITVFHPPKRSGLILMLNQSTGHLLIALLILFYLMLTIYSNYKESVVPVKPQTQSHTMAPVEKAADKQSLSELKTNFVPNGQTTGQYKFAHSYSYSYNSSDGNGGQGIKSFLAKMFICIILINLFFLIRKYMIRAASIAYTITNKRIIVYNPYPKQDIQFIDYLNQGNRVIGQMLFHKILNLYYIQFSRNPIKGIFLSNDRLNYLTQEQTTQLMELFANPIESSNGLGKQKSTSRSNLEDKDSSRLYKGKTIIRSSQRYMIFLIHRIFIRYGIVYPLCAVVILARFQFVTDFFTSFTNWYSSFIFAFGYALFFIFAAYLRASYIIKNYQYIFTAQSLSLPDRSFLTSIQRIIPYQDIFNLTIVYSGFGLYAVNFTGNIKRKVLLSGGKYQHMPTAFCIPGLSKKDADRVPLLIAQR